MAGFDDRKRQEEARYKHDQDLLFKARNRGNKLFGLWIAEQMGIKGDEADTYAKEVVMADFEMPGDDDVLTKVKSDLAAKQLEVSDHLLEKHLHECRAMALDQVKAE